MPASAHAATVNYQPCSVTATIASDTSVCVGDSANLTGAVS